MPKAQTTKPTSNRSQHVCILNCVYQHDTSSPVLEPSNIWLAVHSFALTAVAQVLRALTNNYNDIMEDSSTWKGNLSFKCVPFLNMRHSASTYRTQVLPLLWHHNSLKESRDIYVLLYEVTWWVFCSYKQYINHLDRRCYEPKYHKHRGKCSDIQSTSILQESAGKNHWPHEVLQDMFYDDLHKPNTKLGCTPSTCEKIKSNHSTSCAELQNYILAAKYDRKEMACKRTDFPMLQTLHVHGYAMGTMIIHTEEADRGHTHLHHRQHSSIACWLKCKWHISRLKSKMHNPSSLHHVTNCTPAV